MVSLNSVIAQMTDEASFDVGIPGIFGSLINMHKQGYRPKTVIDVGAFQGLWSSEALKLFPAAQFHLFDPQLGLKQTKKFTAHSLPIIVENSTRIKIHPVLLGAEGRNDVPFELLDGGSTTFHELTEFPREIVNLQMFTLDECLDDTVEGPVLLKIDAQGSELEILKGAPKILAKVDALVLEVATLPYNQGAPLFAEVVEALTKLNFCLYDVGGLYRRETDKTLFQLDLICVRPDHELRKTKPFWINES